MGEEGTLGLTRVQDPGESELSTLSSKDVLQRRIEDAGESISQTVTEIKDTVVNQYESVKETISETLDWREQFKKRPLAWTAGAVGAGFLTGYCATAMIKGDGHEGFVKGYEQARLDYQTEGSRTYAAQPLMSNAPSRETADEGPGLITRIHESQAFDRVKNEAATIGGHLVDQVSKTAQEILVPAAVGLVRHWLEALMPRKTATAQSEARPAYLSPHTEREQ